MEIICALTLTVIEPATNRNNNCHSQKLDWSLIKNRTDECFATINLIIIRKQRHLQNFKPTQIFILETRVLQKKLGICCQVCDSIEVYLWVTSQVKKASSRSCRTSNLRHFHAARSHLTRSHLTAILSNIFLAVRFENKQPKIITHAKVAIAKGASSIWCLALIRQQTAGVLFALPT